MTRRQFVATGLGLVAGGCAARSSRETTPTPIAAPRTAPLIYDDKGGLFVDVTIDGSGPVRMIFDTGASRSTLSTRYASERKLALKAGDSITGSAGSVTSMSTTTTITIAGLGAARIEVAVYEFGSYDPKTVGILGAEYLRQAPFQVHYRNRTLAWNAAPPRRTLPMVLDGGIPRISANVAGMPTELRVDTGATFPPDDAATYLNLTAGQAARIGLGGTPAKVFTATGTGGALLELKVFRLPSLEIAGVPLPDPFAIVQPQVGYFARPDAVGFLGNSVLDKLDPFFDYARGTFGVEPSHEHG
jgi:predicted aspartyl protease